jgi:hypothetical protein
MSSNLISEYLGRGLLSARPVTPDVPAGVAATYFATDTGIFSVWTGSGWQNIAPAGSLSVVQHSVVAQNNLSTGITLASAPQTGNLLIALCMRNALGSPAANTGWFAYETGSTSGTAHAFMWKVASVGEPALQTPTTTSTANGAIAMWEVTGLRSFVVQSSNASSTGTGVNNSQTLVRVRTGFILGAAWGVLGEIPTISGTVTAALPFNLAGVVGGSTYQQAPSTLISTTYNAQGTYVTSQANRSVFTIIA